MSIKVSQIVLAVFGVGIAVFAYRYFNNEPTPVDVRFNGAYQFPDSSLVTLVPSTAERMRMRRYDNGQVYSLYQDEAEGFEVAEGFSSREIIAKGAFTSPEQGEVTGAVWKENNENRTLKRLPLESELVYFNSGDLTLRGKLVLPPGQGPFPVVITVHGSEDYSAVDHYDLPYLLAAHGIAGFKFDKRGTGGSEGEYTQDFPTLASDVVAAIHLLKQHDNIDKEHINLIGLSQGGWIAPLVAKQIDIQSIIVGFGTVVPLSKEDRWGYVKQLLDNGYGEEEIAKADALNELLGKIIFDHDEDAWEPLFELRDKYASEEWFEAISGSDSILGMVSGMLTHPAAGLVPGFAWKMYTRWRRGDGGPNFNRTYNPRTTLASITTPSMWLLAGEDSSLPTGETVEILDELIAEGKPITYKVYPDAEHGNVLFETDASGNKTYLGYAPSYFIDIVDWFKVLNGMDSTS